MIGTELLCELVLLLLALYYYIVAGNDFWKRRGIPGPKPVPLFGNFMGTILGRISIGDQMTEYYMRYKNLPVYGVFFQRQPTLGINDPDVIKTILIKDFSTFASRGLTVNEVGEPLSQHLFALEPRRWRPLRARLSPTFTSGKLKEMFYLILECADTFEKYLDVLVADEKPIDCFELAARFTTDVIGSCAFGIDTNASSKTESKFREIGRKILYPNFRQIFWRRIREDFPILCTLLGYLLPHDEQTNFFTKVVLDTMEYRKDNNIVRHDFIDTLMDLKARPEKLSGIELTDPFISAQAFLFFAVGFEASASTIGHALYEMALNHELQNKVREEIRKHQALNNGEWSYEDVKSMLYLGRVYKEILRKYPPVTIIMRETVEAYTFENLKLTIPKKTKIFIPIYAIHHDPEIYPNPEVFDIDRFKDDVVATRHPMHYLPYGNGPRNCIGARFANFQTKIGLIKILCNHMVDVCEETKPYENNPSAFTLLPLNKIKLKITKLTR